MKPDIYAGLKWGALIGGPLGILETLLYLLAYMERNSANLDMASCILIPLEAMLPFIAGFLAARESHEARSGLIAGLTAGLIVAAINITTEIVYPLPVEFLTTAEGTLTQGEQALSWVLNRVTTIGFGAGFGWFGGQQAIRFMQPPDGRGR